jgi:hypothetical protein
MSPLPSGTYVPIALWVSIACPYCVGRYTRRVGAVIEPVFNESGEDFLGLIGTLRFESCGHRLPGGFVDPVSLVALMEDMEREGRGWEPQEEFDPDNVEVED